MKQSIFAVVILLTLTGYAQEQTNSSYEKDLKSIKSMAGCYVINFNFIETEPYSSEYQKKSAYYAEGLEWVTIDQSPTSSNSSISLQHILLSDKFGIIKHWRQLWDFEADKQYTFKGTFLDDNVLVNRWDLETFEPRHNQWTQRVYEVDDSPRYECTAGWTYNERKGYAQWTCKTGSPLPRREYTTRSDYNLIEKENSHIIWKEGWRMIENNTKVVVTDSSRKPIVNETGVNTYVKVADDRCLPAQQWWSEHVQVWKDIQSLWKNILYTGPHFEMVQEFEGKRLHDPMFELAEKNKNATLETVSAEAKPLIGRYVKDQY